MLVCEKYRNMTIESIEAMDDEQLERTAHEVDSAVGELSMQLEMLEHAGGVSRDMAINFQDYLPPGFAIESFTAQVTRTNYKLVTESLSTLAKVAIGVGVVLALGAIALVMMRMGEKSNSGTGTIESGTDRLREAEDKNKELLKQVEQADKVRTEIEAELLEKTKTLNGLRDVELVNMDTMRRMKEAQANHEREVKAIRQRADVDQQALIKSLQEQYEAEKQTLREEFDRELKQRSHEASEKLRDLQHQVSEARRLGKRQFVHQMVELNLPVFAFGLAMNPLDNSLTVQMLRNDLANSVKAAADLVAKDLMPSLEKIAAADGKVELKDLDLPSETDVEEWRAEARRIVSRSYSGMYYSHNARPAKDDDARSYCRFVYDDLSKRMDEKVLERELVDRYVNSDDYTKWGDSLTVESLRRELNKALGAFNVMDVTGKKIKKLDERIGKLKEVPREVSEAVSKSVKAVEQVVRDYEAVLGLIRLEIQCCEQAIQVMGRARALDNRTIKDFLENEAANASTDNEIYRLSLKFLLNKQAS